MTALVVTIVLCLGWCLSGALATRYYLRNHPKWFSGTVWSPEDVTSAWESYSVLMWYGYVLAGFAIRRWVQDRRNPFRVELRENLRLWRTIRTTEGPDVVRQRGMLVGAIEILRDYPRQHSAEVRRRMGADVAAALEPSVQMAVNAARTRHAAWVRIDQEVTKELGESRLAIALALWSMGNVGSPHGPLNFLEQGLFFA